MKKSWCEPSAMLAPPGCRTGSAMCHFRPQLSREGAHRQRASSWGTTSQSAEAQKKKTNQLLSAALIISLTVYRLHYVKIVKVNAIISSLR